MNKQDFIRLRQTVSDIIFAANQTPGKLDGTYTLELAKGCRELLQKVETVHHLGKEISKEIDELNRYANILYGSVIRMKRMAEVASKTIGE